MSNQCKPQCSVTPPTPAPQPSTPTPTTCPTPPTTCPTPPTTCPTPPATCPAPPCIPAKISVTGISLSDVCVALDVGQTRTLRATISPSNADNKAINWSSNNIGIATVNSGVVTAKKQGTAIITARTNDGGRMANCTVVVAEEIAGIEIIKESEEY